MAFSRLQFLHAAGALALAPFTLNPSSVQAQTRETSGLAPVVVTATRYEQKLSEVLPSSTVIDREEIQKAQAPTLFELLQGVPGVEIARSGGPGSVSSIFMRGQDSKNVAVFIDGIRVQTDQYGTLKIADIPPVEIEKIEIIRGNVSAIHGEAATGGAINIFTASGTGANRSSAEVSLGSRNTSSLSAGHNIRTEDYRLGLSISQLKSEGFSAINPENHKNGDPNKGANPDRDPYERRSLFLSAERFLNPNLSFGLRANAIRTKAEYDSASDTRTDKHRLTSDSSDITLFSKIKTGANLDSLISLTQSEFIYKDFKNDTAAPTAKGNQTNALISNVYRIPAGKITFGADLRWSDYLSYGEKYDRNASGFFLGYSGTTKLFDYQVNYRRDEIKSKPLLEPLLDRRQSADTWLLGLGYHLTDRLKAVGVVSTSFRAPNSAELFDMTYGNANLKPEEHENQEFGLQYELEPGLLRVVGFRTHTNNAIAFDPTIGTDGKFANIAQTKNRGVEATLSSKFQGWNYNFSLVLQDPRDLADNSRLLRRAKQYSALSLSKTFAGIDWGGRVLYSGDRADFAQTLNSYTVIDLFSSKRLSPDWVVRLKLENITNERYQLAYGYNTPGRGAFVTLQYQPRQSTAN